MDFIKEFIASFSPTQSGYLFMWVLLGIGALALIIIIERWINVSRKTNLDVSLFLLELRGLIQSGKMEQAYALCKAGKNRVIPQILREAIKRAQTMPQMVRSAMEEEALRIIPGMERRINAIAILGNIATLIGLMGTIYGLILAFAAVAQPNVSAVQKSSMLAVGISAAMNTTLLGLLIAAPCIFIHSLIRTRIDETISEIDRCAVSILKVLTPADMVQKSYRVSNARVKEEVETETNMVPFMNLMVTLIPLLLSSANFVKMGAIEIKLPEAGAGSGEASAQQIQEVKLDLGVVISSKGFKLFHYFKPNESSSGVSDTNVDIPLIKDEFDYEKLNKELAEIKRKVLYEIVKASGASVSAEESLVNIYRKYSSAIAASRGYFSDHESIKIVAEDKIKYKTIVAVMDAARGFETDAGKIPLFPNVSIAGGVL